MQKHTSPRKDDLLLDLLQICEFFDQLFLAKTGKADREFNIIARPFAT
jgi:hypothetical protein